jgi:CBS domain-containing protein
MKVAAIMNRRPQSVAPHQSLHDAATIMRDHDCGWVPVVDDGQVVGVLTDRDICLAALSRAQRLDKLAVAGSMHTDVHSLASGDDVGKALAMMSNYRVRRLPVIDDGRLVGLVSLSDLAQRAGTNDSARPHAFGSQAIAHTLAAICEPRSASSPV